jgi:hypothetical protein
MILANSAKCLLCGEDIYSKSRHDFVTCKCGNVSVDGGMVYRKRMYKDRRDTWIDTSIEIPDALAKELTKSIDWALENKKNSLGILCAMARALRDNKYEMKKNDPIPKQPLA